MNSPFVTTKVLDYVTSVVSPEVKAELDRMKMSYELSNGSHLEWRTKDLESDPRDSYPEL